MPGSRSMDMTSRERVYRALEFRSPDRAPRDLWALQAVGLLQKEDFREVTERFPNDFGSPSIPPCLTGPATPDDGKVESYVDEWGCVWERKEIGIVGEVVGSPRKDWAALAAYTPPRDSIRLRDLSDVDRQCEASDRFMLGGCVARPFERMQFLRGTENLLMDLAYHPRELDLLRDMVHELFLEDAAAWCRTAVDGITMMDDWGTQQSLLISPATWREFFMPMYRDYCNLIHKAGKKTLFHSDGHIEAIFGDLIEVGMDAVNSQLFCMDIESLAAKYKGKVTFWGEIDRQHILPFGSPEDVRSAVARVRRALDDGSGGLIAQCEWGKGNPKENIDAVFEAWLQPLARG